MLNRSSVLAALAMATFSLPALAQGPRDVPAGHRPPPGLCRVWIDGVPPGRQPRATDCRTAERQRPRNARVIYGDDYARRDVRLRDRDRDGRDDRWERRDRDDGWYDRDVENRRSADRRGDEWCRDADRNGRCDSPVLRRRL